MEVILTTYIHWEPILQAGGKPGDFYPSNGRVPTSKNPYLKVGWFLEGFLEDVGDGSSTNKGFL